MNDFGLSKVKMEALLTHKGLDDALDPTKFGEAPTAKQTKILKKARSVIFLNLEDKVLREVAREQSASSVWKKLEELYMTKSLANRLYLKQRLYSFKFSDERAIGDQLDQFNKILDDLENVDAKMEEEDKAIALLNALPKSFEHLRNAMLYGQKEAISLVEVESALKSKDLAKAGTSHDSFGDVLNIKKFKQKGKNKGPKPQFQKSKDKEERKETRSCRYCKKPGHLKKNCFSWKRKQEEEAQAQGSTDVAQEAENVHVMNVAEGDIGTNWIVDSGCSFHICSHKEWFEEIVPAEGSVLLGNNQRCSVHGIGKVRFRLGNGSVRLLMRSDSSQKSNEI